jgi:hypothetical protein
VPMKIEGASRGWRVVAALVATVIGLAGSPARAEPSAPGIAPLHRALYATA